MKPGVRPLVFGRWPRVRYSSWDSVSRSKKLAQSARNHYDCRRTRPRVFTERSEPEGGETERFSRPEARRPHVLSTRLEPGLHQRTCLFRHPAKAVRTARCAGIGVER